MCVAHVRRVAIKVLFEAMKFCLPSKGLGTERNIPWVFDKGTSDKSGLMAVITTSMATSAVLRKAQTARAVQAPDADEDPLNEPANKKRRKNGKPQAQDKAVAVPLVAFVARGMDDDSQRPCTWMDDVMHALRPARDGFLEKGADKAPF